MKAFRIGIEANPVFPYYMQHRMDDTKLADWEKNRGKIMERPELSKEDNMRAEYHAYRDDRGYYIPTEHILGAIKIASKEFKSKTGSGRKSMKDEVAGGFFVQGDENPEKLYFEFSDFQIDKRSAVNQNNKARIIVIRPKFKGWKASFNLMVDNETVTSETIRGIVEHAGQYVGIGSYRPPKGGAFGRFKISTFAKAA